MNDSKQLIPVHRFLPFRDSEGHELLLASGKLPDNCTNGIRWIDDIFSDCVDTNLKLVGFCIGFLSLILWLMPLIPQLLQNYRTKRCEGLSIFFLLFWLIGDTCNMTGALLTDQQAIQKIIGVYYIFQDFVLLGQYIYYNRIYPNLSKQPRTSAMTSSTLVVPVLVLGLFAGGTLMSAFSPLSNRFEEPIMDISPSGRRLLVAGEMIKGPPFFYGYFDMLGYVFGSVAALCYFLGRIPQLLRNYYRKSCEGLSLLMFYIIIAANFTYGVSVLLESAGWHYIFRHLPWLAGSLGCCLCDMFMIAQYYHYEGQNRGTFDSETSALLDNENDDEGLGPAS